MFLFILLLLNIYIENALGIFSSASFYGDSFTFEQLKDFSSESTVSIQFQTRLPDGILLIAVGQHDFFIISLNHGRIQVHLNVNSKEGVLKSPSGVQYNDQLWHQLNVVRIGSRVDIRINNNHVASERLWVNSNDDILKIDLGVFLGGYDESVTPTNFDVPRSFFRGCIINAMFNEVDVLHPLHNIPNQKLIYNVEPGFSRLFRARHNEAMSIDSPHAYLKYHRWTDGAEGTFDCRVKTRGQNGLIMFNSGWKRKAFVGLEMIGGTVRGSMNSGSGIVALQSTIPVNDGKWHRIKFTFTSTYLEIRIGKNRTKIYIEHDRDDKLQQGYSDIKLKGPLYVGGVEPKLKDNYSLRAAGLHLDAFPGCVKNVRVDYRPKQFHDILASHQITVGCNVNQSQWSTVLSKAPSFPTFVIIPLSPPEPSVNDTDAGLNYADNMKPKIKPEAPKNICYKPVFDNITIKEGSTTSLNSDFFRLVPIIESETAVNKDPLIQIKATQLPKHGNLYLNESVLSLNESFLWGFPSYNHLSLYHDGTETNHDRFSFAVIIPSNNQSLQEKKFNYRLCDEKLRVLDEVNLTFDVHVTSVEDPPVLEIPGNYIFRPVRNARTPLSKQIFNVTDNDSPRSEVVYHVLGLGTGLYIENSGNPGRPVADFTQSDIDSGLVNFVDAGGQRNARLLLQVTNLGQSLDITQMSSVIRISTVDLRITVINNTGITLVEGESCLITSNHLSSLTNAGTSLVDVLYTVTAPPTRGQLQVLLGADENSHAWVATSSFQQSQLSDNRVRYLNHVPDQFIGDIVSDRFSFNVSGADTKFGPFFFNITVLKVTVSMKIAPIILRNGSTQVVLSTNFITVHYSGLENVKSSEIQVVVLQSFAHFEFLYRDTGLLLSVNDTFTLHDFQNERMLVRILPDSVPSRLGTLHDRVTLMAVIRGRYRSESVHLNLTYIPDVKSIKLTSSTLLVDEGAEARISRHHLFAQTLLHQRFLFEVVDPPKNGLLRLRHPSKTSSSSDQRNHNVTSFTSRDINEERLYYRHDSSEEIEDDFKFRAIPILDGELPETIQQLSNVSASGVLNISITLVNDNSPIRIINKPFEIARNSQRLLTRNDLWYHDPDVDQDDLDLKYVRRGITNGEIVNATSKKKIFEFTQRDIVSDSVLFCHKKADFGRFVFWVRDGKHFATGLFVVRASQPYLRVNSSEVLVEKESSSIINNNNLHVITNLAGLESAIKYRVIKPPIYGQLHLGNQSEISEFTQHDIDKALLRYENGASPYMRDNLTFSVTVKDESTTGVLNFRMFLASLQQPPIIRRNRAIVVRQSDTTTITRSDFRATHQDVRPRNIIFTIRTLPQFGYFLLNRTSPLDGVLIQSNPIVNPSTFSQWDVNQNHLSYVQSSNFTFDPIFPIDNFTFDVSNGILSLVKIEGHIDIVPKIIPLKFANFTVGEGKSRVLIPQYLDVPNRHFNNLDIDIYVTRPPSNGMLARDPRKPLDQFSLRLVRAELISYTHDGSDTIVDSFQLQARIKDGSKQSDNVTIHVTILPDNDQVPEVVNNTGLLVWINSITPLSSSVLAAVDLDTPPENITYKILPPQNGYIAMMSYLNEAISSFTQHHINNMEVVFVHRGSNTGGFTFQVDDGRNFDNKHIFVITARLLVISPLSNSTVQIFPSTLTPITGRHLQTTTNDEQPRDITHYITAAPLLGEIVKKNTSNNLTEMYSHTSYFTQYDIDSNLIFYNQSRDLSKWNSSDWFVANVTSFPAKNITNFRLTFNISYDNYKLINRSSSIKVNAGANIAEGSSFNFTLSHLDASNLLLKLENLQRKKYALRYRVLSAPLHGEIRVGIRKLSINDSFLHRFIEEEIVVYSHDDSEDDKDHFLFEAYLQHKSQSSRIHPIRIQDRFNITVDPINDNPPKLDTKNPHIDVVQGHNTVINSTFLKASDVDSSPNQIRYSLIRAPTYGRIKLTSSNGYVDVFSQQEVNDGVVTFEQNMNPISFDGNNPTSDAFYFSLSDGFHRPSYNLFMIKIYPVSVRFSTGEITFKQGEISSVLSTLDLHVTSNGDVNLVRFSVFDPPVAGGLYVDNKQISSFTYHDLISSRVTYVMSNLTHDSDHMTLMVGYSSSHGRDYVNATSKLQITVIPRIYIDENFDVPSNTTINISSAVLNATQLATYSSSLPIFHVEEKARHAKVILMNQTTKRRDPSPFFSQHDVASGHVFLAVDALNLTNLTFVPDRIKFRLSVEDNSVQPALCLFPFNIVPSNLSNLESDDSKNSPNATTLIPTTISPTSVIMANSSSRYVTATSSFTSSTYVTQSTITSLPVGDLQNIAKEATDDSSIYSWLLPLLIALCVVVFIIIIIICFFICRRKNKGPVYVQGQESPPLKATLLSPTSTTCLENNIDSDTVVRITSRADSFETPQRCLTAPVVVTPLRKSAYYVDHSDLLDDGFCGDNYMSNSMPPEGHLSGLQKLTVASKIATSSPQGLSTLHPDLQRPLDNYSPFLGEDAELSSCDDSLDFAENDEFLPRRNNSSASLSLQNRQLSAPPRGVNQYWI